jgi:hypothetical protein
VRGNLPDRPPAAQRRPVPVLLRQVFEHAHDGAALAGRLAALGGRLEVRSAPGQATTTSTGHLPAVPIKIV